MDIGQDGLEHGVAVGGVGPRRQMFHIEAVLFLIVGGHVAELVAEGVGSGSAGASGGFLGGGDENFGFALIH